MNDQIIDRIELYREKKGLNQDEFAKKIGLTQSTYSKMKRKETKSIKLENAIKASEILDVSLDYLAKGETYSGYSQEMQDIINRLVTLNPDQIQAVSSLITTFYDQNLNTKNAAQV